MKITGAKAVALALKKLGVSNIWGIPGAGVLPLYDELRGAGIKTTLVANELSAAFMADGYYRVSGKPGVCIAIPGPGLTNMLTGIAEAFLDSSAIVVITIDPRKSRHGFYIHDVPQLEIVRPVVKKILKISSVSQVTGLCEAYHYSYMHEPGPVVVELGGGVMDQEIECPGRAGETGPSPAGITDEAVAKIRKYIGEAGQVGIYAGRGCMGAGKELLETSRLLSAPIATTISGRGVVPEDYELSAGYGFGRTGSPAAYRVFKKCNLVLAVGVKFSEMATGGWGLKFDNVVRIDAGEANVDRDHPCLFSVQADAKRALEKLNRALIALERPVNAEIVEEIKKCKMEYAARIGKRPDGGALSPANFLRELRKCAPRDSIFVTDVGYHQLWSLSDYEIYEPGTYLTPADYQAMGFGIPAAIGAATAKPEKKIVCVCGDGGFQISGFELLTAKREKLDLSVFIFNDGALGLIKGLQGARYNRTVSSDLENPDFRQLASSFGVRYFRISSGLNLKGQLVTILGCNGVNLVECEIVYDELASYIKGSIRNSWDLTPLSRKMSILYKYVKCRLRS